MGTPIGNMSDMSLRAHSILSKVAFIACEDTRHSGKLLKQLKLKVPLISFHQHNTQKRLGKLIEILKEGKSIALISDAGLPGISDPGEELVAEAKKNEIKVICIPGPCAATTALVSSGLPSNRFCFEGFLPSKKKERNAIISNIANEKRTTILYESRYRLIQLLNELAQACGNDRPLYVARELTKKYEESVGSTIETVINHFKQNQPRGEFTLILGGKIKKDQNQIQDESKLLSEVNKLIESGYSSKLATKKIADEHGIPKRLLYSLLHKSISTNISLIDYFTDG